MRDNRLSSLRKRLRLRPQIFLMLCQVGGNKFVGQIFRIDLPDQFLYLFAVLRTMLIDPEDMHIRHSDSLVIRLRQPGRVGKNTFYISAA